MSGTMFLASGIENGLSYGSVQINGSWQAFRYSPAPLSLNACACSVDFICPKANGQVYCSYGHNCTVGTSPWTTPGIIKGCVNLDDIFLSDLRCFFDQTCLDTLLSLFNYDLPSRPALPEATRTMRALSTEIPSRFSPIDMFRTICEALMIEEWIIQRDFDRYYAECAPASCSYSYSQRLDIVYMVTTIVALFGGLVVMLPLLVPIGVKSIDSIVGHWQSSRTTAVAAANSENPEGTGTLAEFLLEKLIFEHVATHL
jgi:hypothetical protein